MNDIDLSSFATNLKALRRRKKVSLRDMAADLGISASAISNYENGQLPTLELAVQIAEYFEISMSILLHKNINDKFFLSLVEREEIEKDEFVEKVKFIKEKFENTEDNKPLLTNRITNKLTNIEGTEALHSCQNEVSRLEGLLAEKEELIKELRARITDKEDMVSMLKNQLKAHESTQNQQNEADNIRKTG